jgi:hypothetical protein
MEAWETKNAEEWAAFKAGNTNLNWAAIEEALKNKD